MKWTTVEQNWAALVPSIVTRWPEADADEVSAIDGSRDALNIYLGQVAGITPDEAAVEVDEWLAGPAPSDAVMDETQDNAQILHSARDIPEGEDVYSDDAKFGDDRTVEAPAGRT